jgi:hypothetical protein
MLVEFSSIWLFNAETSTADQLLDLSVMRCEAAAPVLLLRGAGNSAL